MEASHTRRQQTKLTQVMQNFFIKTVQVVHQARVSAPAAAAAASAAHDERINKWFNLYMPAAHAREDLRLWRGSASAEMAPPPPMIIETYLDLRRVGHNQTVVLRDDARTPWTVAKGGGRKQEVVLERWLVEFDAVEPPDSGADELPLIYKQAIVLVRSLYTFTRLMPAFGLAVVPPLAVGVRVLDGKQPISSKGRIGLSKAIVPSAPLEQRHFHPIRTTMGTLKVSVAFRRHCDFGVHDSEELLSTHFSSLDRPRAASGSVSPCSSVRGKAASPSPPSPAPPPSSHAPRPSIQPFKIGSFSTSPPAGALERRVSITSNKSASNASLVAMLRNPRNSTSSSNTTSIPIARDAVPRSVSSSHADESSPTPRFSSSFGSRASRRFSSTSMRQSSTAQDAASSGSMSSEAPLSGIYIDDDINDFVKMIDSKSDLRFHHDTPVSGSGSQVDALSRFQSLRQHHQQLGDSLSASLTMQLASPSRTSSRKSSHSVHSPAPGSYDAHVPTIHSRLRATIKSESPGESAKSAAPACADSAGDAASRRSSFTYAHGNTSRLAASPVTSTTTAHAQADVSGLATTPSAYKRQIHYENVFEDDDDDVEDFYKKTKARPRDDDDDDLLFTMSDMNLTK
ncbi:Autophagy-related protein 13 [[Candida] zeylanoides]